MDERIGKDPNFEMLVSVADALGELRNELVFLGGCATTLLITRVRTDYIRPTMDVDVVAAAVTATEYHALERRLEQKGFHADSSADAPICRKTRNGIKLDVMPSNPDVFGFANRWYPEAVTHAEEIALRDTLVIRVVTAPVFVACKLEAFKDRGRGDYLASHDLEDLLAVVDGREEFITELETVMPELRKYIAEEIASLLADDDFKAALPGHLPADAGSQARLSELLEKLKHIAGLRE